MGLASLRLQDAASGTPGTSLRESPSVLTASDQYFALAAHMNDPDQVQRRLQQRAVIQNASPADSMSPDCRQASLDIAPSGVNLSKSH